MAVYIKEIKIKNFRSIDKLELSVNSQMNVFVGLNDVGKSNVLKALNLFFNGETDYEKKFNFNTDFCNFAKVPSNAAKEIEINVLIHADGFKEPNEIWFKKRWRIDSSPTPSADHDAPSRSRMPAAFERMKYHYIPAVKGNDIFKTLLAKLYTAIPEKENNKLVKSAKTFSKEIGEYTKSLSKNISDNIGIESIIKIPDDMQNMFQALTFSTNISDKNSQIPLDLRGDGIKARHIPSLLKFISERQRDEDHAGKVNTNIIWGYEEPENGVELLKCFEMANEFLQYSNLFQIFITTHSPGFYSIGKDTNPEQDKQVDIFFVKKMDNHTHIEQSKNNELDETMGFMPLIAPYLQEKVNEIKKLRSELDKNEKIIFVSGFTDEQYFNEANKIFKILPNDIIIKNIGKGNSPGDRAGDGALDTVRKSLKFYNSNSNQKIIFIYDCDAPNIKNDDNAIKLTQIQESKVYKIGIENLLNLPDDFDYDKYYYTYNDTKRYGEPLSGLKKSELCADILALPKDEKIKIFSNFESVLQETFKKFI